VAAPKTPARVWVLLATIVLLLGAGLVSAVAIPTFRTARDLVHDQEAQRLLDDARQTAIGVAVADGAYTALTTDRLGRNDPFHTYTSGPSTGARELSVATGEDGFALAVRSDSGRCWVVETSGPLLSSDHPTRTGRLAAGRACDADGAHAMREEDFDA
jgi:hypothetical protein